MLTRGDDYPIHQLPEPVAVAGSDRNFYDRYFFNGYARDDGAHFFAAALGVYPHLNVMDASFAVIHDGVQHNIHASRILDQERMDTRVGPIRVEVLEPLRSLRIVVEANEHGVLADLTFYATCEALEEPRFTYRSGPRTILDYTRLTQNGAYEGWIEIRGVRVDVRREQFTGTRDRSWGIRPVGAADSQPVAPPNPMPQFYWLWAPVNFPKLSTFFGLNEDCDGNAWHESGAIVPVDAGAIARARGVDVEIAFKRGTRHAERALLRYDLGNGRTAEIHLEPEYQFYMAGLGYMHPEWGHGVYQSELKVAYEAFDLAELDETAPLFLHVQAFSRARLVLDGETHEGSGVLEQLIIGPHAPSGFNEFLDGAS